MLMITGGTDRRHHDLLQGTDLPFAHHCEVVRTNANLRFLAEARLNNGNHKVLGAFSSEQMMTTGRSSPTLGTESGIGVGIGRGTR